MPAPSAQDTSPTASPTAPSSAATPETSAIPSDAQLITVSAADVQAVMFGGQFPAYGPETRDGKLVGIRVSGVKPGSAAERLGARDGDVVEAVNGVDLTTFDAVSRVEASTRNGRRFVVRVLRDGHPTTLVLELTGAP